MQRRLIPLAVLVVLLLAAVIGAVLLRGRPAALDPQAETAREACIERMSDNLDEPTSAKWDYLSAPRRLGEGHYRWETSVTSNSVGGLAVKTAFTCDWQAGAVTISMYGRKLRP